MLCFAPEAEDTPSPIIEGCNKNTLLQLNPVIIYTDPILEKVQCSYKSQGKLPLRGKPVYIYLLKAEELDCHPAAKPFKFL